MQAIDEELDLIKYDTWNVVVPEGQFLTRIGNDNFFQVGLVDRLGRGRKEVGWWVSLTLIKHCS
jgi:hypothetical protein